MDNKLIKFLKDVLSSMNLGITADGYIRTSRGKDSKALLINKLPLVLPIDEQLNTLTEAGDTGNMELIKTPYNPLTESIIHGDGSSLKVTKNVALATTIRNTAELGKYLLIIAADASIHHKTRMAINNFLTELSEIKVNKKKLRVDKTTIEKWIKIYNTSYSDGSIPLIKIYSKKNGTIAGKKYNRVTTLTSPLLKAIKNAETGTSINGVKLRALDIEVFTKLLEFILDSETGTVVHSSNHTKSPGFISIYGLYIKIAHRHHKLLNQCSFIDSKEIKLLVPTYEVTVDDLEDIDIFDKELAIIPNDNNLLSSNPPSIVSDVPNTVQNNTAGMSDEDIALANILNKNNMNHTPGIDSLLRLNESINVSNNNLNYNTGGLSMGLNNNMGLGNSFGVSQVPGSLLTGGINGPTINEILYPKQGNGFNNNLLVNNNDGILGSNTYNTFNTNNGFNNVPSFGTNLSSSMGVNNAQQGVFVDEAPF